MPRAPGEERRDFLVDVAKLYHEQGRSQAEIARRFRISRSLVSNLLKRCREQGIVEIRINDPRSRAARLQRQLCERFGLAQARVVSSGGDARAEVGRAAAALLEPMLAPNLLIGISWGTTLHALVSNVRPAGVKGVQVVQLHGGLGAGDPAIDGFGLAQKLAAVLSGSYRAIPAPIIVQSGELRDLLLQEPRIRETLALGARSHIALFGIGSNLPAISSLVRSGILSAKESQGLVDRDIVGTVCGLHVEADGSVASTPLNRRLVGLSPAAIAGIPVRLGVAAGARKTTAVRAALLGKFVTVLVVDESIADRLVEEQAS